MAYVKIRTAQDVTDETASGDAFIDTHGKVIFSPLRAVGSMNGVEDFHEGRAAFSHHGKWGYFNKGGAVVVKPQFTVAQRFADGLAAVYVGGRINGPGPLILTGGHWGFIDRMGRMVIPARYRQAHAFSEGMAFVELGNQQMYIDRKGQVRVSLGANLGGEGALYLGGPFSSGLAQLTIIHGGSKTGFINKSGRLVLAPRFADAGDFSEGLAAVKVGTKWGYTDKSGRLVIRPEFSGARGFHQGLAAVAADGHWRYIDRAGAVVIRTRYNVATDFESGLARVHEGGRFSHATDGGSRWKGGSWYYIDRTGLKVRLAWPDRK